MPPTLTGRVYAETLSGDLALVPISDVIAAASSRSPFVPDGYHLTFDEDFSDFEIVDAEEAEAGTRWIGSWKNWNIRHLKNNNDRGIKVITSDTHEVIDGNLVMRGFDRPQTAQSGGKVITLPFTAPMISTELGFKQKYGYFEFRAKMKISQGHHMAFWLLPADGSYANKSEIAEVDMVEVINGENRLHFNHVGAGSEKITAVNADPAEAHTYGLLWEPGLMVWFLDGKEVRRSTAVMEREAYLLASLEIAGKWPGWPDEDTRWPAEITIDYWRAYQRSPD